MIKAISVTQLNSYIRNIFDAEELLHNIDVVGEVFGVSVSRGVIYFSLKDENATLPCVCFNSSFASLIREGANVVVTGSPNFYVKGGKLNFNVTKVKEDGLGKLYEEFLKMKEKLEREGLFSQEHKKQLPRNIKRIGVITSKEGAVLQDIKNVAWRRNPSVDIVLYSTKVQGKDAEKEIAHAIEMMSDYPNIDVIIVARGGGSLEDLSAYNTELVARATYNCKKPIVSAVGHETDFTIIDFVSDLRAPTPSASAELLTINLQEKREEMLRLINKFNSACSNFYNDKLRETARQKDDLIHLAESKFLKEKTLFEKRINKLLNSAKSFYQERLYALDMTNNTLEKLNPKAILNLGYARIEQDAKPIKTIGSLNQDNNFEIIFIDGKAVAKINKEEK
jgi:exodeoxyribonuclease VII large subunit